jgi:predicted transcriptional regulator
MKCSLTSHYLVEKIEILTFDAEPAIVPLMEIQISPEQEAQLAELASRAGRGTDDIAREALADGMAQLCDQDRIRRAIAQGVEDQRQGRLVDGEAVLARIEAEIDAHDD